MMKAVNVNNKNLSLTIGLKVNSSSFEKNLAFQNEAELDKWLNNELKVLMKSSTNIQLTLMALDGLKVGDSCHVNGEGLDLFEIKDIIQYDNGLYTFVMLTGERESVLSCFKNHDLHVKKSLLSPTKMKKFDLQSATVNFRN